MTRQPAMTLIEVIVTMFIMAIGLLALMVLFPLGAINMGHALKDDRCASTAAMAENVAIIYDVRHDASVTGAGSSFVYIDPNGAIAGLGNVGTSGIPRRAPTFATTQQLADRWFSLPDDISFNQSGTPDTVTTAFVERGRRYSFAYLARVPTTGSGSIVDLVVVVYSNRPIGALSNETTVAAAVNGSNGLVIGATGLSTRRGGWVLVTGTDSSGNTRADFYRVANIAESGGATNIEVAPDLVVTPTSVTLMDYVAEVFDKGTSWRP